MKNKYLKVLILCVIIVLFSVTNVTYAARTENLITDQNISGSYNWVTVDKDTKPKAPYNFFAYAKWIPCPTLGYTEGHQPLPAFGIEKYLVNALKRYRIDLKKYKSAMIKGDIYYEGLVDMGNNTGFDKDIGGMQVELGIENRYYNNEGMSGGTYTIDKIPGPYSWMTDIKIYNYINTDIYTYEYLDYYLSGENAFIDSLSPGVNILFKNPRLYLIDEVPPEIIGIKSNKSGTIYKAGEEVIITLTFDEDVTVDSNTELLLKNTEYFSGGDVANAKYISGNGTSVVKFKYVTENGKMCLPNEYLRIMGINNASYIKDIIGNNAVIGTNKKIQPGVRIETYTSPEIEDIIKKYSSDSDEVINKKIVFTIEDYLDSFNDKNGDNIKVIKILSLPSNGKLAEQPGTILTEDDITKDIPLSHIHNIYFIPDDGFTGVTSFKYKVYDDNVAGSQQSNEADVIIIINSKPVVSNSEFIIDEDSNIEFSQENFTDKYQDVENQELDKIKITLLPDVDLGRLLLNNNEVGLNDEIEYDDLDKLNFKTKQDANGETSFEWKANDGYHYSGNVALVSIKINNVIDEPTFNNSLTIVDKEEGYNFNLQDILSLYNDVDGDELNKVKITILPTVGMLKYDEEIVSVGKEILIEDIEKLKYVPSNIVISNVLMKWQANDGELYSNEAILEFHINNRPISLGGSIVIDEDVKYTFTKNDFEKNYIDDNNDLLNKVKITVIPQNGELKLNSNLVNNDDEIAYNDLTKLKFEPNKDFNGETNFMFCVYDGYTYSEQAKFNIIINPVNDAPVFNDFEKIFIYGNQALITKQDILNNIVDVDGKLLTKIKIMSVPSKAKIKLGDYIVKKNDQLNVNDQFVLEYVSDAIMEDKVELEAKVFDGMTYSNEAEISIYINNMPEILKVELNIDEDNKLEFKKSDFENKYSDENDNDLEKIKIITLPISGMLEFDGVEVTLDQEIEADDISDLDYIPNADYNGKEEFIWTAYDGYNYSNEEIVEIIVNPINDKPQSKNFEKGNVVNTDIQISKEDFLLNFYDIDGDELQKIKITTLPDMSIGKLTIEGVDISKGDEINSDLDKIIFTPVADVVGDTSFKWKAYDGDKWSDEGIIKIDIYDENDLVKLAKESLRIMYAKGDSASSVKKNIVLNKQGLYETIITWESSDELFINSKGIVNRPSYNKGNKEVKLVATILKGSIKETKEFTLQVIKKKRPSSSGSGGSSKKKKNVEIIQDEEIPSGTLIKKFKDLEEHEWAREAIEFLVKEEVVNGTGEETFEPGLSIKRGDFVKFLVLTLKLEAEFEENFNDVKKDKYYYNILGIAKKLKIATGDINENFNPEEEITREDMMTLTARALKIKYNIQSDLILLDKFDDKDQISDYAKESVSILVKEGLIKGSNNKVNPKGKTIRAEIAVLMYRLYLYSNKDK